MKLFSTFSKAITKYRYTKTREKVLSETNFGNSDNEFYLISFPKSGNTWMRFLFANLITEGKKDLFLKELEHYIPDSQNKSNLPQLVEPDSIFNQQPYKIVKSHDPYLPFYKDKKVIYVVRDGRDVMNSYFHYTNARRTTPLSMACIIRNAFDSPYGTWAEHIENWTNGICKQFHVVKYEDLKSDTFTEVKHILKALNWQISDETIRLAVEKSSFARLQSLEKEHGVIHRDKLQEKKSLFFRNGKVGDWSTSFSEDDVKLFWEVNGKAMKHLGYSNTGQLVHQ